MTSATNGTVFRQTAVKRDLVTDYSKLEKEMDGCEDAASFFMLADAACSSRPVVDIERIDIDIFKNQKTVKPIRPPGLIETIEIMHDPEMMRQLRASLQESETVPWRKIKLKA